MVNARARILSLRSRGAVALLWLLTACGSPFGGLSKVGDKYHPGATKNVEKPSDPAAPSVEAYEFTAVDGTSVVQDLSVDPAAPSLEAAATFGVAVNEQGQSGVPMASIVPTQSLLPDATESACGSFCEMNKIFMGFFTALTD